jgi:hypothetical protein
MKIKWYVVVGLVVIIWLIFRKRKTAEEKTSSMLQSPSDNLHSSMSYAEKVSKLISEMGSKIQTAIGNSYTKDLVDGEAIAQNSKVPADFIKVRPMAEKIFGAADNKHKIKREYLWWPEIMHDTNIPEWNDEYEKAVQQGRLATKSCGCGCGNITFIIQ